MKRLPVFEPRLLGTEGARVQKALAEGQISGTSPIVGEFEKAFARFAEVPHAVAVANGTCALHVALLALGIGPGDEVIVPACTIISDAIGVLLCGAKPVYVDVRESDYCLDVQQLAAVVTPRTRAVLAVHMYGNACDMDFLVPFCQERGLFLVEDAAQAMGGTWRGKPLGSFGQMATYSFYPNKLITTGEGGAVTCSDPALREKALVIRNLGFNPDPDQRFIHVYLSNNYRLSGLQAAMGLAQLEGAAQLLAERARVRAHYRSLLAKDRRFALSQADSRCEPAFWMQTIVLNPETPTVSALGQKLAEAGIETRRFFYPLPFQPVLQKAHGVVTGDFAVSQRLFDRGLYLPSAPSLTEPQIQQVCRSLAQALTV